MQIQNRLTRHNLHGSVVALWSQSAQSGAVIERDCANFGSCFGAVGILGWLSSICVARYLEQLDTADRQEPSERHAPLHLGGALR